MSKYSTIWYRIWEKFTTGFSQIQWTGIISKLRGGKSGFNLQVDDWIKISELLASGYYIILTRRKTHLTTYSIAVMTWLKTGKWPIYSHVLLNLDLITQSNEFMKFKLMEATSKGVHYSEFNYVFDCDYVCLLQPVNISVDSWEQVMEAAAKQLGKPYDNLFDIMDSSRVSCVEMVLDSLRADSQYSLNFANLQSMINHTGNLTPQMYRDCQDFKVILEIKR